MPSLPPIFRLNTSLASRHTGVIAGIQTLGKLGDTQILDFWRELTEQDELRVVPFRLGWRSVHYVADYTLVPNILNDTELWSRATALARATDKTAGRESTQAIWAKRRPDLAAPLKPILMQEYIPFMVRGIRDFLDQCAREINVELVSLNRALSLRIFTETILGINVMEEYPTLVHAMEAAHAATYTYTTSLFPLRHVLKVHRAQQDVHQLLKQVLKRGKAPNFIPVFNKGKLVPLKPHELIGEFGVFLFTGYETTGSLLTSVLYCFDAYPTAAARVSAEIRQYLSTHATPLSMDDFKNLPELDCFVKEVLRFYPPIHIIARIPTHDTTLGEQAIKRGQEIFFSPYAMHFSKKAWGDPWCFDPQRFKAGKRNPAYLPFSGGPRICIGEMFSKFEAKILLCELVQRKAAFKIVEELKLIPRVTLAPRTLHATYQTSQ